MNNDTDRHEIDSSWASELSFSCEAMGAPAHVDGVSEPEFVPACSHCHSFGCGSCTGRINEPRRALVQPARGYRS